jgi:hypothetical protein
MYTENQNKLDAIIIATKVAKSRWQTKDGKWWTNDGSGKKPYNPNAGGAPLTSSGKQAQQKAQNGRLSSTDAEAKARRQMRDEGQKNIPEHMMAGLDKSPPASGENKTTRPAHSIKNVRMMSPKSAVSMYKNHLKSDPEFAKHEGERVGKLLGTGKSSLDELLESIEKTDLMEAHRDVNQAYIGYHAKKNPST